MPVESPLTPVQRDDLRAIAGAIIPASVEFDVPGADDPVIQADIVATLGRDGGLVRDALIELARLARVAYNTDRISAQSHQLLDHRSSGIAGCADNSNHRSTPA